MIAIVKCKQFVTLEIQIHKLMNRMFLVDHSKGGNLCSDLRLVGGQVATSSNAHKCSTSSWYVLSVICSPGTQDPRFGQPSPTPLPPPMSQPMIFAVDFPLEKWYGQSRDGEPRETRLTCAFN